MEIRLYLAQINPTVGDLKGNHSLILSHIRKAGDSGADIVIFPELSLTGYPPEDLLLKNSFLNENTAYIEKIKKEVSEITAIIGFADSKNGLIYNSAAVISGQNIKCIYNKQHLPNYSVFDEERYFSRGDVNYIFGIKDHLVGLSICEDIFYASGPIRAQSIAGGAELVINISASPYYSGKVESREKMISARASDNIVNIAYLNMVGGQDELVFDGNSIVVNEKGQITARCRPFEEDSLIVDIDPSGVSEARIKNPGFRNQKKSLIQDYSLIKLIDLDAGRDKKSLPSAGSFWKGKGDLKYTDFISCPEEEILEALVLGTRDYIKKNRFRKVLIALSGGIDSALIAFIAVRAVGKDNVTAVFMPSDFSSVESMDDAETLSNNLGIEYMVIPISGIYKSYLGNLKDIFKSGKINVTRENIQARIRGNIIMAFSNEHGGLVLSTGNKSEISVGYCTLYGDMVGGFSPIKDVYKTMVYSICNFINKKYGCIIPENILSRPPSAELRPDQTDQDRLPPYSILDSILKAYIEEDKDCRSIINMGFDPDVVKDIINMVDSSEYKRRQGSPGVKITARAFGRDRRYPITNRFRLQQ
jgi:NAD+ synthase (glutamine-hydrolysing)